jgi:hypothetical protein
MTTPIPAKNAVVWTNHITKRVMVVPHKLSDDQFWGRPERHGFGPRTGWSDPIGAAYTAWRTMKPAMRVQLMLETIIDLAKTKVSHGRRPLLHHLLSHIP